MDGLDSGFLSSADGHDSERDGSILVSKGKASRKLRRAWELVMSEVSRKERALAENYRAFEELVPELLKSAPGKFALMYDRGLVELFDSAGEAHAAGRARFDDGLFSVQKVEESAINLGFFSYARYYRAA